MNKTDLGNSLNEKIEDLNLIALRKYACPKVSGQTEWYLKCLECPGLEDCACGRRVRDILEDQTAPNPSLSWEERVEEAFKRGNPAQWLVNQGYYSSIESAKAQIRKYNQKYGLAGVTPQSRATVERTMDRLRRIFDGADTMEEILTRYFENIRQESKVSSLFSAVYRWCRTYPEMAKKYPLMRELALMLDGEPYKTFSGTVAEYRAAMKGDSAMQNNENDQVSIDDFLKETAAELTRKESAPVMAEPVLKAEAPAKADPPAGQEAVRSEFQKKKTEYLRKLAEVEALRAELTRKIKLLDETAALFGLRPEN